MRTHRSRTATEGHEELVPTTRALDARESLPRVPTAQQPPELSLDILRKRLAIVLARVRQEGLEMLEHQPVQHLPLRLAPLELEVLAIVSRRRSGHSRPPEPPRPAGHAVPSMAARAERGGRGEV